MTEWMTKVEVDHPPECQETRMRRAKNFGDYIDHVASVMWKGTHTAKNAGQPDGHINLVSRE